MEGGDNAMELRKSPCRQAIIDQDFSSAMARIDDLVYHYGKRWRPLLLPMVVADVAREMD